MIPATNTPASRPSVVRTAIMCSTTRSSMPGRCVTGSRERNRGTIISSRPSTSFRWPRHDHIGDAIAEAAARAAEDHLQYLELMHTADAVRSGQLGAKLGWDDDFASMREKLLAGGLKDIVAATSKRLDRRRNAKCAVCSIAELPQANAGCGVTDSLSLPGATRSAARE